MWHESEVVTRLQSCNRSKNYKARARFLAILLSLKNLVVLMNTKLHSKSCYYLYWFVGTPHWNTTCTVLCSLLIVILYAAFWRLKLRAAAKALSIPTNEFGRVSQRLVDRVFDKHHTDGLFGIKRKKFPENRGPKHHNANRKVRLVLGALYFLFVRVYLCHSLTTSFLEYHINR